MSELRAHLLETREHFSEDALAVFDAWNHEAEVRAENLPPELAVAAAFACADLPRAARILVSLSAKPDQADLAADVSRKLVVELDNNPSVGTHDMRVRLKTICLTAVRQSGSARPEA